LTDDLLNTALDLRDKQEPFVLVKIVQTVGSVPQEAGAGMIVSKAGRVDGTVGGGKLEARCLLECQDMLSGQKKETTRFHKWKLDSDIGMTCGGSVQVYFELYAGSTWRVVIFGAGHCAQALCRVLSVLPCRIVVVDNRSDWLAKLPEHAHIEAVAVNTYADYVENLAETDFVVLMTMGHSTDSPVLVKILQRFQADLPYLGVIGSKAKRARLVQDLQAAHLSERSDAFFCPVGLDIGGNAPGDIAVSVAAQLLAVKDKLGSSIEP
jgi:xanthine dehydrogenase accessory factor